MNSSKTTPFARNLNASATRLLSGALDSLKANIAKATETLVKHLDSNRENISIQAAESIIEFTQKALVSGSGAATLVLALATQSSPLTVQPSTIRVGANNTNRVTHWTLPVQLTPREEVGRGVVRR